MLALCDGFVADAIRPLYEQLHAWAKHTSWPDRYKADAPEGQDPRPLASEPLGAELARPGRGRSTWTPPSPAKIQAEYITEQAEAVLRLARLPEAASRSFYSRNPTSTRPTPKSGRKKNSARLRLARRPPRRRPQPDEHRAGRPMVRHGASRAGAHLLLPQLCDPAGVPYLLRAGANRAFHEGIGDLIGVAAGQRPYLNADGPAHARGREGVDQVHLWLLDAALDGASITFLPVRRRDDDPLRSATSTPGQDPRRLR